MALSDIFFAVSAFLSSHICRRIGLFKSMYIQKWKVQRGPKLVVSWSSQWDKCVAIVIIVCCQGQQVVSETTYRLSQQAQPQLNLNLK